VTRRLGKPSRDTRWVDGATWRLAEEVQYIQRRAAEYDSRIVTIGPLLLFSTQTGDAWVLDPADHLALPAAREGKALPVQMVETAAQFVIGWTGQYHLDGDAFAYVDKKSRSVRTLLGYPTRLIAEQSQQSGTDRRSRGLRSLPAVLGSLLPRRQQSRAARAGRRRSP
jgi:hypothetical protein